MTNEEILSEEGVTPLVSNMSVNNGVMGFSNLAPLNTGNTITCSDTTLGAETMYYQERDYIGYQHIQAFVPKFQPFNKAIASFIISSSRVATSNSQYDYGHKFNRPAMRATNILLPVKNNNIDFNFMESFIAELESQRIAELESQRIAELESYLKATGLSNYELSTEERYAVEQFDSVTWSSFNVERLFNKATRGKRLKGLDRIKGTLPFVTAGETNEGISAYISNNVTVFEKNTVTIDMFGSAKYRNYKYGADDHVAIVHTENIPMEAAIFITSAIHKAAHTGEFDYGRNFYPKDADALDIMLPVKDDLPDYQYMGLLISAVQKLVIKDVVEYADKKIEATKLIVKRGE